MRGVGGDVLGRGYKWVMGECEEKKMGEENGVVNEGKIVVWWGGKGWGKKIGRVWGEEGELEEGWDREVGERDEEKENGEDEVREKEG